ncbi:hypothetical protein FACS189431_2160 [Alphaproteobacteria bacterium]|nr:hypothetical protein FACS189431_2160 [Alphaproteobacteria bacterium]
MLKNNVGSDRKNVRKPKLTKAKIARHDIIANVGIARCKGATLVALNANRITDKAVRNATNFT